MNRVNTLYRIGAVVLAAALIQTGVASLRSPKTAAKTYGLTTETTVYVATFAMRDIGFGASIIALLVADHLNVLPSGSGTAASIVMVVAALVGIGDSFLIRAAGGQGSFGNFFGASAMLWTACGLWATARLAQPA